MKEIPGSMNRIKGLLKIFIPTSLRTPVKSIFLKLFYFGNHYYCPLCKSFTRSHKPLGYDFRVIHEKQIVGAGVRNALCPVCESSDRIRLLYLFLNKYTNVFRDNLQLLHIAPEPSLEMIFQTKSNIKYLTADLHRDNVMERMDITQIDYPDQFFDAVICNHVLEHIPDDLKAMKELFRILKPGGWAILQVPWSKTLNTTFEDPDARSEKDRERIFGQSDHVRIYGKDYTSRLREAGFSVQEYKWVEEKVLSDKEKKYNLNRDEIVFYCTRDRK